MENSHIYCFRRNALQMVKPLSIFGGQEASEIAGSSSYIDDEELKKSGYTDTERIMGRVPGVFTN